MTKWLLALFRRRKSVSPLASRRLDVQQYGVNAASKGLQSLYAGSQMGGGNEFYTDLAGIHSNGGLGNQLSSYHSALDDMRNGAVEINKGSVGAADNFHNWARNCAAAPDLVIGNGSFPFSYGHNDFSSLQHGLVRCNGKTISVADQTDRANADTKALFDFMWSEWAKKPSPKTRFGRACRAFVNAWRSQ